MRRIVSAVDTGIVVNPGTVVAQREGGLIFGLTAALYGEITLDKGRGRLRRLPVDPNLLAAAVSRSRS